MYRISCRSVLFASLFAFAASAVENSWISANGPSFFNSRCTLTLLADGRALAAGGLGGSNGDKVLNDTLIYDPVAKTWKNGPGLITGRYLHTATLLQDGRVLFVGGSVQSSGGLVSSAELYDPVANKFSAAASMAKTHFVHTATLLASGKVLVCGGGGTAEDSPSAELYDPTTNTWASAGDLTTPRSAHTATLLNDGRVLIAGGSTLNTSEIYDPALNKFSSAANMSIAHRRHEAVLFSNGNVMVLGGDTTFNANEKTCEIYNPSKNTWTTTGFLPGGTSPIRFTATLLNNDRVLVVTGRSDYLYLPSAGVWINAAESMFPHEGGGAARLASGNVLVTGSGTEELYVPPAPNSTLIFSALTATVAVGKSFSYRIMADGTAPITYSAANLPAGLNFTGGNTISGVPMQAGQAAILITATGGGGSTTTQILRLTITGGGTVAVKFTSNPVATPAVGMVNQPVTFDSAISNPDGDLVSVVWNFGDGTFGIGTSVSHTYVARGVYPVSISAGDATGTAVKSLNLAVLDSAKNNGGAISFSETYKDVFKTFHEEGDTFSDVVPAGIIKVSASINGAVPASGFSKGTAYLVVVGGLSYSGTLGEAQKFSDGKSAKFVFITFNNKEQEVPIGGMQISRSSKGISVKIGTKTVDADPSIYAAQFEGFESAPIDTTLPVTIVIGDAVLTTSAKTTGAISTVIKKVGSGETADEVPLTTVSLKGSATATGN